MKNFFTIIVIVIIIALSVFFVYKKYTLVPVVQVPTQLPQSQEISITKVTITEQNYSGSYPKITGSGAIADAARIYISSEIASFAKDADSEVPDMRRQFGANAPMTQYTIDIDGTYQKGDTYDSIILTEYVYTGGANGASTYKVFTQTKAGNLVSLKDILNPLQEKAFITYVKKELLAYQPDGSTDTSPLVFADEVNKLTIGSLTNWSMNSKGLDIYFDQYAVAPGVVGTIDLQLPISVVGKYLK